MGVRSPVRSPQSILRPRLTLLAAATVALAGWVGTATAAPPLDLPDELVDQQGVLTDPDAVRTAQDALYDETGRQLFVVVVDDLDGRTGPDWLTQTARLSGLGEQDLALVVTTQADGAEPVTGTLRVPSGSGIRSSAVAGVERDVAEAAATGDPDAVVTAALTGLREAGVDAPGEAGARALLVGSVLVVVLAVVAAIWLWLARRARRVRQEAADTARATELSGTLGSLVVALDQQLQEAALELDLARARVEDASDADLLTTAQESFTAARADAVQVHRRRAELTLGPTDDLTWRVPPGEAVAELEALHGVARSAQDRLRSLRLPG